MSCHFHPERASVNTCSRCGEWLCSECSTDVNHQVVCKSCLAAAGGGVHNQNVNQSAYTGGAAVPPPPPMPSRGPVPMPGSVPPHGGGGYYGGPRKMMPNSLLLFFTCMLPGAGYMYLGLMKRGLAMMALFFGTIYMAGSFNSPLFGLMIPVIVVATFFDCFNIRRKMFNGEVINDSVEDITGFISRFRLPIICVFVFATIMKVLDSLYWGIQSYTGYGYGTSFYHDLRGLLPVAIIGGALFMIFTKKRGACKRPVVPTETKDEFTQN